MSNKLSPTIQQHICIVRVPNLKWLNKPCYIVHLSCTTTDKNQFELVTASLNHVLPTWNGSTPWPLLEFPIFPSGRFVNNISSSTMYFFNVEVISNLEPITEIPRQKACNFYLRGFRFENLPPLDSVYCGTQKFKSLLWNKKIVHK